jgi:hypothetical protein
VELQGGALRRCSSSPYPSSGRDEADGRGALPHFPGLQTASAAPFSFEHEPFRAWQAFSDPYDTCPAAQHQQRVHSAWASSCVALQRPARKVQARASMNDTDRFLQHQQEVPGGARGGDFALGGSSLPFE